MGHAKLCSVTPKAPRQKHFISYKIKYLQPVWTPRLPHDHVLCSFLNLLDLSGSISIPCSALTSLAGSPLSPPASLFSGSWTSGPCSASTTLSPLSPDSGLSAFRTLCWTSPQSHAQSPPSPSSILAGPLTLTDLVHTTCYLRLLTGRTCVPKAHPWGAMHTRLFTLQLLDSLSLNSADLSAHLLVTWSSDGMSACAALDDSMSSLSFDTSASFCFLCLWTLLDSTWLQALSRHPPPWACPQTAGGLSPGPLVLQSFLKAHFVYHYLVYSLELSWTLTPSPILFWVLDHSGLPLCLSHVRYLFTCYLPFYHMHTIFTC